MTRDDTIKLLAIMRVAWPKFYANLSRDDAEATVTLWSQQMQDYPAPVVNAALQLTIKESPYPPTISDICSRIAEMVDSLDGQQTPEAMWAKIAKAAADSLYHAEERFKELPEVCKRFVGGPSNLRSMGMMDDDTFQSVTRGQFLRGAQTAIRYDRIGRGISPEVRALLGTLGNGPIALEAADDES